MAAPKRKLGDLVTNVQTVWMLPFVIRWMEGRERVPKKRDRTALPGGSKLGTF